MRFVLLILLLNLSSISNYGQEVAIQLDKMNVLYTCVENPYTIVVNGYSLRDLLLTIDNGEIKTVQSQGGGTIIPAKSGKATVYVKIRSASGIRELKKIEFRVRDRPTPKVKLDYRHGGEISKSILCAQIAPGAYYDDLDYHVNILSFTIIVRRDTNEIFKRTMANAYGTRIDTVTHQFFRTLQQNDKVFFTDIMVEDCDSMFSYLEPMLFIISNRPYSHTPKPLPDKYEFLYDPVTGQKIKRRK